MSTSSAVFVVLVVFATTVPIAIFAWVAGKKHRKVRPAAPDNTHQSVKQETHRDFDSARRGLTRPPTSALRAVRSRHLSDPSMGPASTGRRPPQRVAEPP